MKNSTQSSALPAFLTNPNPEVYLGGNYVVFDFETTSIGKGLAIYPENRIVSVGWSCGPDHVGYDYDGAINYKRAGEYDLDELISAISRASFVVCHNAKFDLQWAARAGLDLSTVVVYDTLLGEYVLGGNKYIFQALSLDNIAQRRWNEGKTTVVSTMIKSGVDPSDIPEGWLERYCIQDVALTERLFLEQREELNEINLLPVLYNRCLLTPVLADIEHNGVQIDAGLVRTKLQDTEREYAASIQRLDEVTGGVNCNSRLQLIEYIYETLSFDERKVKKMGRWQADRTPSGAQKVDVDTIANLKAHTKQQKEFLDAYIRTKELFNELTKYLRKFGDCCENDGGHMLAVFNQTNTKTHRLSSSGLKYSTQFQNFPRSYKPLFCARNKGWLIGECDGAQLEFRVAVHLGRDGIGLDDIVSGTDIHKVTAGIIGCTRQEAKPHTFKPLYGGRSGTPEEMKYYQFFREKYVDITATQQRWIDEVLDTKQLTTEWGLRYYWPDTKMDRSGYVRNTTSICNYPVQAFATAEIIPLALVFFWHRLKRSNLKMFIVNTVHDSIIVELPPEEINDFHYLSRVTLIDDVYSSLRNLYGIDFTVPLGSGVKVATHWSGASAVDHVPEGMAHDKGEVVYTAEESLWACT